MKHLNVLHGLLVYLLWNILDQIHFKWFVLMSQDSFIQFGPALRVRKKMVQTLNQDYWRTWVYLLRRKLIKLNLSWSLCLHQEKKSETGSSKRQLLQKKDLRDYTDAKNLSKALLGEARWSLIKPKNFKRDFIVDKNKWPFRSLAETKDFKDLSRDPPGFMINSQLWRAKLKIKGFPRNFARM